MASLVAFKYILHMWPETTYLALEHCTSLQSPYPEVNRYGTPRAPGLRKSSHCIAQNAKAEINNVLCSDWIRTIGIEGRAIVPRDAFAGRPIFPTIYTAGRE